MPNKEFIPESSQSMSKKGTESVNNNENGSADAVNNEKGRAEVQAAIEAMIEAIDEQNTEDEKAIAERNQKLCKLLSLATDLAMENPKNIKIMRQILNNQK